MATPSPYAKDFGNLLYRSAVVGGLSVGYSMGRQKAVENEASRPRPFGC